MKKLIAVILSAVMLSAVCFNIVFALTAEEIGKTLSGDDVYASQVIENNGKLFSFPIGGSKGSVYDTEESELCAEFETEGSVSIAKLYNNKIYFASYPGINVFEINLENVKDNIYTPEKLFSAEDEKGAIPTDIEISGNKLFLSSTAGDGSCDGCIFVYDFSDSSVQKIKGEEIEGYSITGLSIKDNNLYYSTSVYGGEKSTNKLYEAAIGIIDINTNEFILSAWPGMDIASNIRGLGDIDISAAGELLTISNEGLLISLNAETLDVLRTVKLNGLETMDKTSNRGCKLQFASENIIYTDAGKVLSSINVVSGNRTKEADGEITGFYINDDNDIYYSKTDGNVYVIKSDAVEEDPYGAKFTEIKTAEDFAAIADNPAKIYKLTEDITLPDDYTPFYFGGILYSSLNDRHSITVNITAESGNAGLFSNISGATIDGIILEGSVTHSGSGYVGGIAGAISSSTGGDGEETKIKNCINNASVSGKSQVGGIIGRAYQAASVIENCVNNGDISGTNQYVGGIAGFATASIKGSENNGAISARDYAGGIVGWAYSPTLNTCANNGNVSTTKNGAGGIAGRCQAENLIIENCYNTGTISCGSATSNASGIAPSASGFSATVRDCYNTGDALNPITNKNQTTATKVYAENCYYEGESDDEVEGTQAFTLKPEKISDWNFSDKIWKLDKETGYPIFK